MPKSILLVEDHCDHQRLYAAILNTIRFEVIIAMDAAIAMEIAHRANLVMAIVDIFLPSGDGRTVIQEMRAVDKLKDLPILAISASTAPGFGESCLAAGATRFRSKPIPLTTFIDDVKYLAP